jgi:hypothetical protein
MTERSLHPDHELVELALGDIGEPMRSQLIRHLVDCATCRANYDVIVVAVDSVLPAAPQIAPPVGFEQRTLDAMGVSGFPSTRRPSERRPRARMVLAAAAAVLAGAAGGGLAIAVWDDTGSGGTTTTVAADSSPLRTSDGEVVGFAALSYVGDRPALIVNVSRAGASGVEYRCRILLADGDTVQKKKPWALDDPDGSMWIESAPDREIVGMELVTDDGRVWAAADLP